MTTDPIKEQKDLEFYGQTIGAWLTTSFEFDRSLLTLSTLGLGFNLIYVGESGIATRGTFFLVLAASIAFVFCIVTVLATFRLNKRYLEKLALDPSAESDTTLERLDLAALGSFAVATILSLLLLFVSVSQAYKEGQKQMNHDDRDQKGLGNESIGNLGKMSPEKIDKSANNLGRLSQRSDPPREPTKPSPSKPQNQGDSPKSTPK